jgi:hypothetical protein
VSTESTTSRRPAGVDWRRAEFVLTFLGFVGFLTLPIRITTIYSGLPAHPLFVHVPVILIPATVIAAVLFVFKPVWLSRYGIALALASIVAMSSVFLTMQAGAALRAALHLRCSGRWPAAVRVGRRWALRPFPGCCEVRGLGSIVTCLFWWSGEERLDLGGYAC